MLPFFSYPHHASSLVQSCRPSHSQSMFSAPACSVILLHWAFLTLHVYEMVFYTKIYFFCTLSRKNTSVLTKLENPTFTILDTFWVLSAHFAESGLSFCFCFFFFLLALLSSNFAFSHATSLFPSSLTGIDCFMHAHAAARFCHNMKHWNTFTDEAKWAYHANKGNIWTSEADFTSKAYLYGPFCPVECVSIAMCGQCSNISRPYSNVFILCWFQLSAFVSAPSCLPSTIFSLTHAPSLKRIFRVVC